MLAVLGAVASEALDLTGFYYSGKPSVVKKKSNQVSGTNTSRYAVRTFVHLQFPSFEKESKLFIPWERVFPLLFFFFFWSFEVRLCSRILDRYVCIHVL